MLCVVKVIVNLDSGGVNMSRIGKLPVNIPDGVQVKLENNVITVKGPKGELTRKLHDEMIVEVKDNQVIVTPPNEDRKYKALWGLTRTLVNNMVEGVTKGFQKNLELVGVGYRAQLQGKKLVLQVGYSHPVEIEPGEFTQIEVPAPNKIIVKGIDKEEVGSLAANIRAVREPEPYKGKGIRYEGEHIKLKAGKAGAK